MRFPEAARMAEDGGHSPVWARTKRSGGGGAGIFGFLLFLLALFGLLVVAMAGMNHWSFARAGGQIDGWICTVVAKVHGQKAASTPASAPAPVAAVATPAAGAPSAPASSATAAKPAAPAKH